ncbi:Arsenate reductase, glutaredoxin family [Loktanella sp. DSM 29012]|uniref:arsenate reductase family protein n=1 Tax=Loktanella sp. DSM 29012 TaxID=1881056 RepID=UPI0008AB83B5|nr:ArsC/Spx/MgsR family protein [Loktanella sp. DSM 29012]SEQ63518.1 Arsenate reductase, glutaredoxin family [Loktanella sp. DSM 29012]
MRIFSLKTCDTCRKAIKALRAAGHDPVVIDVRADGIAEADLTALIDRFGDDLINRSSATWRQLSDTERAGAPHALLAAHPTLMKRPVIQNGDVWTLGWKADAQAAHIGQTSGA